MGARLLTLIARVRRQESGAVLVEFVVILPLVLILLLGVIEIGRGLFYHHYITNGVRDGLRYLSRAPLTAAEIDRAKAIVVMGLPADYAAAATITVPPAWTPPNAGDFRTPPQIIWISAQVPIPFPLLGLLGLDTSITFTVTERARHIGE